MFERIANGVIAGAIVLIVTMLMHDALTLPKPTSDISDAVSKAFARGMRAERARHCQCTTAQYLGKPCGN